MMQYKVKRPLWVDGNRHELVHWVVAGLPVTIFYNKFGPDTFDYLDWHWHEELQLCLALSGDICVQVGEASYPIGRDSAILINSRQLHKISRRSDTAEYVCMDISQAFPCQPSDYELYRKYREPVLGLQGKPAYVFSGKNDHEAVILDTLHQMWECYQKKEFGYELDLYRMLLHVWKEFILTIPAQETAEGQTEESVRLRKIISFIRREYMNNISLNDVADSVYLSKSECCRFFRKATGQLLFAYISHYRIDKSLELLTQTDKKISVIAAEVGFSTQSYYTECFKKQIGLTPYQFRQSRQSEGVAGRPRDEEELSSNPEHVGED